ncbi:MAG: hypothetical protein ABI178_16490 [Rhodanobacter sp.]
MNIPGKVLTTLCIVLLAACGDGASGTYEGGMGSISFASGKAEATLMGNTIQMDYTTEGDKIVLHSPQGNLVLKRNADDSLDTPWGTMKKKD